MLDAHYIRVSKIRNLLPVVEFYTWLNYNLHHDFCRSQTVSVIVYVQYNRIDLMTDIMDIMILIRIYGSQYRGSQTETRLPNARSQHSGFRRSARPPLAKLRV